MQNTSIKTTAAQRQAKGERALQLIEQLEDSCGMDELENLIDLMSVFTFRDEEFFKDNSKERRDSIISDAFSIRRFLSALSRLDTDSLSKTIVNLTPAFGLRDSIQP